MDVEMSAAIDGLGFRVAFHTMRACRIAASMISRDYRC